VIILQDIYRYEQRGVDSKGKVIGDFQFTGIMPTCLKTLREHGIHVPSHLFEQ